MQRLFLVKWGNVHLVFVDLSRYELPQIRTFRVLLLFIDLLYNNPGGSLRSLFKNFPHLTLLNLPKLCGTTFSWLGFRILKESKNVQG